MNAETLHAQIAATIARAKMENDPSALLLEMQWMVLDRMEHLSERPERPFVMAEDDMRKLWAFARREAGRGMVRVPAWRWVAVVTAALVVVALIAGVVGYGSAGGFSTRCKEQQGGVVCFRWVVPPTS